MGILHSLWAIHYYTNCVDSYTPRSIAYAHKKSREDGSQVIPITVPVNEAGKAIFSQGYLGKIQMFCHHYKRPFVTENQIKGIFSREYKRKMTPAEYNEFLTENLILSVTFLEYVGIFCQEAGKTEIAQEEIGELFLQYYKRPMTSDDYRSYCDEYVKAYGNKD